MSVVNKDTVNTLRFLSVEAVQKANSGHPGLPMGAAPMACALWGGAMKHNPKNPKWVDRDRFVMSAGHGSALLYSLLHVFGYDVSLEDLKNFRQHNSKTPGHPEFGHTDGIEITTGPLGQGIANGVGFAWAENYLAAKFNKPDAAIVDHYTYVLCGDGCLQEGVAAEAISLAGTLGLGKLIILYDSNKITIEGSTDLAFTENVLGRFIASNWDVHMVNDGDTNLEGILSAIEAAKKVTDKPSIIEIQTTIGFGTPKQGTAGVHGSPLGDDGIEAAKKTLGWEHGAFTVPAEVSNEIGAWQKDAAAKEAIWNALLASYKELYPTDYAEWENWQNDVLPDDFRNIAKHFAEVLADNKPLATRVSSEKVLQKLAQIVPQLIGGSADLAPSTNSWMKERGAGYSKENPTGSNLHFGIREHAMTAIANAMAAHGGLRPYVAGFFVFSDYMKPSMRLSALMGLPVVHIMTHDSIGVGEDGPTHQPLEQLAALRSIPNFHTIRPCDTTETAAAWAMALTDRKHPTALVLCRQPLPQIAETGEGLYKGAYILKDSINSATGKPDVILMASGSEVELIYNAQAKLLEGGIHARVISMPCMELFDAQDAAYKESILPASVRARLAVEAASPFGWHKYTGLDGEVLAIEGFGASAPAAKVFEEKGFTVDNVVTKAKLLVGSK
ncbi:MAG: transketolase [Defluviitaleaceae bacterium]|nr:transketolase [Defluviitaleaceae bacterium]MCL2261974.1 transketolase [Defluviitaleaceae bacterium]